MEKETKFETEQASLRWFDPMLILRDVSKRWAWILLVAVAVTVGTYIFSDLTYKPVYQSSATFVVTNTDSAATVYNDLESTANVALVFEDLLNGVLLREKILPYVDGGKFTGTITTAVVPETNLLTVMHTLRDMADQKENLWMTKSTEIGVLMVGCVVSFLVSLVVIRGLMEYVRKHSFAVFGIYRIVLGIAVLAWFALAV